MGEQDLSESYVYLYRHASTTEICYVGYGHRPARALSHAAGSHNAALERWLVEGAYRLEIAGPYGDDRTGLAVEAALISALQPRFNRATGSGPQFVPMGVPAALADRLFESPASEEELAMTAGGVLFMYLSDGKVMKDGRIKANPASPDVEVIASNTEAWWQLSPLLKYWRSEPEQVPKTLVAAHGPTPRARFVIGSFHIDTERLIAGDMEHQKGGLWKIPLTNRSNADALALRGRRLTEIRFGQRRPELFHWVDGTGTVRWNGREQNLDSVTAGGHGADAGVRRDGHCRD